MAIHSSTLDWEIPWTEKPGGLQSMGSRELDMNLATEPPGQRLAYLWTAQALGIWGELASLTSSFGRQAADLLNDLKEEEGPLDLHSQPDHSWSLPPRSGEGGCPPCPP